jgi:hypothetical protein
LCYPRRFAGNRAFHRAASLRDDRQRERRPERQRAREGTERDKAVQVSLSGFGQHENPICERPRHLAMAITSSNFV